MNVFKIVTYSAFSVMGLIAVPGSANAQETHSGFGIHGGANFSNFDVTPGSSSQFFNNAKENKTGFVGGIHFEMGANELLVIRPEVNFSQKGYSIANVAEVRHDYIEIPVLFKLNFLTGAVRPFVQLGPQFSFNTGSEVTFLGTTTNLNNKSDKWDIAGVAGAGLGLQLAESMIVSLEGRYNFGLRDLSNSNDVEVKSRGFQAMVGVTFIH